MGKYVEWTAADEEACNRERKQEDEARKRATAKSRYRGVRWREDRRKWLSEIWVNGKRLKLGSFRYEVDAARAHDVAAREHFRYKAKCNFPVETRLATLARVAKAEAKA